MAVARAQLPAPRRGGRCDAEPEERGVALFRNAAAGVYQYLRGEFNELVFEFQDQDLDALKRKIEHVEGIEP